METTMNILNTLAQSNYYYTERSSNLSDEQAAIIGLAFFGFFFLLTIVAYVIMALALMRIFKKAGIPAWIAWVPFYNNWKLLEIGGQQGFWAVLAVIPLVNIAAAVFMYIAMYNVGLKLDKSGTFVLFAIFLPIVWFIWPAVDKSVWNEAAGEPSLAEHTEPIAA